MATGTKLELLQRLSTEGKTVELQAAITQSSCKDLRGFIGQLGIPVRSKDYAVYNNKAGYADLLFQILGKSELKPKFLTKTRKTKTCNFRLVNVIFGEALATIVDRMNAEPHQTALDSDQIIQNHPFWERVRGQFLTTAAVEYSKIVFHDSCFEGYDLSAAPVLHSSEKLWKMWRELCAAYTSATARFEKSRDPDSNFFTFCRNRVDVYYLRCWLNVKPQLLVSVNGKLQPNLGLSSPLVEISDEISGISRKRKVENCEESEVMPRHMTERMQLMKAIREACETLKTVREANLGGEVEEAVTGELATYTKRLKYLQEEETSQV
ncbi:hypothetical protein P3T76_004189 [Phytophthora citrophthora]|uniref:Uncharacterized protein n=1 Tax=Phytophthora citrophthora TaxID=4793 RepID=A0AAD9GTB1_9STRA|nr:hypothetical protein P3T76_004189 [Phytophthora citrophthora]